MGYLDRMNLYEYTSNNPISRVDPLGLLWKRPRCPLGALMRTIIVETCWGPLRNYCPIPWPKLRPTSRCRVCGCHGWRTWKTIRGKCGGSAPKCGPYPNSSKITPQCCVWRNSTTAALAMLYDMCFRCCNSRLVPGQGISACEDDCTRRYFGGRGGQIIPPVLNPPSLLPRRVF